MRAQCLAALCLLACAGRARATPGSSLLNVPVSARGAALGDGAAALASGADMSAVNPAGILGESNPSLALSYAALPANIQFGSIFLAIPGTRGAVALGARTLSSPGMDGRDANGVQTGAFNAADYSLEIAGAHSLGYEGAPEDRLQIGGAARYVSSRIAGYSAQTALADVGAQGGTSVRGVRMRFGAAARDLGPGRKFLDERETMPAQLSAGAALEIMTQLWLLGGVTASPSEQWRQASLGVEYSTNRMMSLRGSAGYRSSRQAIVDDRLIFAVGARVNLGRVSFDYAFLPMADAGFEHRMGIILHFGLLNSETINVDNAEYTEAGGDFRRFGLLGAAGSAP